SAYLTQPARRELLWLVGAVALACAAKYSAVLLIPLAGVAIVSWRSRSDETTAARGVRAADGCGLLLGRAISGTLACPGVRIAPAGFGPWPEFTVPASVASFGFQIAHQRAGHPAFLFGSVSRSGWWYYMPVALALKSTPAELIVLALGAVAFLTRWTADSA